MARADATRWIMAYGWCALPEALAALGRWPEARRVAEAHLAVAERHGMHATAAHLRRLLGAIALRAGELATARARLVEAARALDELGGVYERALAESALGELELAEGAGPARLLEAAASLERMGARADAAGARAAAGQSRPTADSPPD